MKFAELNLDPSLIDNLNKMNFSECTPIQAAAMPIILEGKDLAGLAQTGTGKTAAFVLPLIERLARARQKTEGLLEDQISLIEKRAFKDWRAQNFILVLVPTRELAEQVFDNIKKLGSATGIRSCAIYGGTSYDKQKEQIANGIDFIVATPGRLIDLYKENVVDLKQVRAIVFDEADRMFDMGFKDDMKYILQRVPRERQFLVFSATLNFDVLNTAYQFGAEPIEVDVSRDQAKAENVKDEIFHVGGADKPSYLLSTLKIHKPKQTIIFSNFKNNVDRIVRFLNSNNLPAVGISSLLTQAQRNRVMEQFKGENEQNILVATDVAARGLDIKGVDLVVNYELPMDAENYVHRIGRTGRAGAEGRAISFVSDMDVDSLGRIEDYLKHKISAGWIEDQDLVKEYHEFPRDDRFARPDFRSRDGGRPQRGGDRGPRKEGRPGGSGKFNKGPRPQRRHDGRGDHKQEARSPQQQQRQDKNYSQHSHSKKAAHKSAAVVHNHQGRKQDGQRPKHTHRRDNYIKTQKQKPGAMPPAPKSIAGKVSSFFKKIFG